MKQNRVKYIAVPIVFLITWLVLARYTFNPNLDLNGDNFTYYNLATALSQGKGYCDLSQPGAPATSTFPPGYPVLMTPLRAVTDSFLAQKWMNELFYFGGVLLLYLLLLECSLPFSVCVTAAFSALFCPLLWHFSTMMMSEASFFFFTVLVLLALKKTVSASGKWNDELKNCWLYVMIVALSLVFHIRTQGIAMVAGVLLCLLIRKRWTAMAASAGGFALLALPWIIRNKIQGLSGNRYLDVIKMSNPWRPEEGAIGLGEVVKRFFDTLRMLVFNAIPSSSVPFLKLNADEPEYNVWIYIAGVLILALIIVGFLNLADIKWGAIGYVAATLGVISIFSTPSGSRYISSITPLLNAGIFVGLWWFVQRMLRIRWKKLRFPAFILLPLLLTSCHSFKYEHQLSNLPLPEAYSDFFKIGEIIKKSAPRDIVVCSRKPAMLYLYSNRPQVCYKFTTDARDLLLDLCDNKVDYIVVENLGYGSTYRYLIPAITSYPRYFIMSDIAYRDSGTFLIVFNRALAEKELR